MNVKPPVTAKPSAVFLVSLHLEMNRGLTSLRMLLAVVAAAVMAACASIGRPEGGPRDEAAPVFVKSDPMPGTLNFAGRRMTVMFDENVQLDDPTSKIVVSPPQKQPPKISASGRRVTVDFIDTLLPDMTYTVDFADAVKDLNEGNVLDGFALDFSTGGSIDTLSISGMVFEARNLEPAQGMIVGVYNAAAFTDTTLTTLPLERITKTSQTGVFTVRNLAPGNYRIFALNDLNRDYHWDRSEDVAFYDVELRPEALPAEYTDTIAGSDGLDSVVTVAGVRYVPDDVLLTWFNENYSPRYLLKNERPERRRLELIFSAAADSATQLTIAEGPHAGAPLSRFAVTETSAGLDTITVWLTDTTVMAADTLRLSARYQFTDSTDQLSWRTDTIPFILRGQRKKPAKEKAVADTAAPKLEFISFSPQTGSSQDLNMPLAFKAGTPIARIDSAGVRLEMVDDSLLIPVAAPPLSLRDSLNLREFTLKMDWKPSTRYRLTIDSAAVTDVYGLHNKPIVHEFTTKGLDDYSALFFNIVGLPDSVTAVVELLRGDDPERRAATVNGTAALEYITPGTYYARLFIDRNGNGEWDTGSIAGQRQPEEVVYFPKKLNLKKNWDVEQTWNIYETPVDLQKPADIKKNKPKLTPAQQREANKKGKQNGYDDEDDEDDMMWNTNDPFSQNPAIMRRTR